MAEQIISHDREVFEQNRPITYELWFPYPDGRRACFEMRQVPFLPPMVNGSVWLALAATLPNTSVIRMNWKKASQDKTTFISTISHELRTPLNGVVGLKPYFTGYSRSMIYSVNI